MLATRFKQQHEERKSIQGTAISFRWSVCLWSVGWRRWLAAAATQNSNQSVNRKSHNEKMVKVERWRSYLTWATLVLSEFVGNSLPPSEKSSTTPFLIGCDFSYLRKVECSNPRTPELALDGMSFVVDGVWSREEERRRKWPSHVAFSLFRGMLRSRFRQLGRWWLFKAVATGVGRLGCGWRHKVAAEVFLARVRLCVIVCVECVFRKWNNSKSGRWMKSLGLQASFLKLGKKGTPSTTNYQIRFNLITKRPLNLNLITIITINNQICLILYIFNLILNIQKILLVLFIIINLNLFI